MSTVLLPSFIAFTIPFESSNSGTPLPTRHLANCQKPVLQTSMDGLFILHVPFPAMKIQSFPSWESYHLRYIYILYYNILYTYICYVTLYYIKLYYIILYIILYYILYYIIYYNIYIIIYMYIIIYIYMLYIIYRYIPRL